MCSLLLIYVISLSMLNEDLSLQKKVLAALENAGVFTSGGLVKDKVTVKSMKKLGNFHNMNNSWHSDFTSVC